MQDFLLLLEKLQKRGSIKMGFFSEYLAARATISAANAAADAISGAVSAAVEQKDKLDVLKSLTFVVSYKSTLSKEYKKEIVNVMQFMDESISLFTYEPEIDSVYQSLQSLPNAEAFFKDVLAFRFDREKIEFMYMFVLILTRLLNQKDMFTPQQLYNLSLMKKQFNFTRQELGHCYHGLAQVLNSDTDDIAEELETITGDEAISHLLEAYPDLIEIDKNDEMLYLEKYPSLNKDVFEKIKELYTKTIQEANDKDFAKAVKLIKDDKNRINNAINEYAQNAANEIPILFYDSTILSNGKAGLVLTNKNIYIGELMTHESIPLRNIFHITSRKSSFSINNIESPGVNLTIKTAPIFVELLQKVIKVLVEGRNQSNIEDNTSDKIKEIEELYYDSIQRMNDIEYANRLVLPDMKPQVIQLAVGTYAKECVGENALLLYANDAGCSGKEGFFITNKKLYVSSSGLFSKPQSIPLKNIVSIECQLKNYCIKVNDIKLKLPYFYSKPEIITDLFELLQKVIPLAIEVE